MDYPACSTPHVSPWTAGQACPRPVRSGPKYEQTPISGTIVYKNIYCPWPSQTKVWRTGTTLGSGPCDRGSNPQSRLPFLFELKHVIHMYKIFNT